MLAQAPHSDPSRRTSVEGLGGEVAFDIVHKLFTNVPETSHPFFITFVANQ